MDTGDLLGTIRVPRNLSLLTDRLPKANYETEKKKNLNEIIEESIDVDAVLNSKGNNDYQRVVGTSGTGLHSNKSGAALPGMPYKQKRGTAGKPPI